MAMVESVALPDDVESLKALGMERDAAIGERDLEIQQLREYVRLLKSQRFGASSERIHRDQLGLFNEAEQIVDDDVREEDLIRVPSHIRARGAVVVCRRGCLVWRSSTICPKKRRSVPTMVRP
jgi:hypothetical protein